MVVTMACKSNKSIRSKLDRSLPDVQSMQRFEDLQDANAKLKMALEFERNSLKQLRREMTVHLKQVREEEHQRAVLTIKDLKTRFHFEKVKDLEHQKECLTKKFDLEYKKVSKSKDGEIKKLKVDFKKLQDQLELAASPSPNKGLSVNMARDTFENEKLKLQKEVQELQVQTVIMMLQYYFCVMGLW